jgi:hypothetical protein
MNAWMKKLTVAGLVAAAGLFVGCRDNNRYDRTPNPELRGTGGSGQVGDGKIGNNNGVLNDGEGPLEENHDANKTDGKIGNNNGVLNDGEGPLEQNHDQNGRIGDGKIGNNNGVLNDGEGPLEQNHDPVNNGK